MHFNLVFFPLPSWIILPKWVWAALVLWQLGIIPVVEWCPPPEQRPFWLALHVWPWSCE